ncbi:unnamed protein product [Ambrosiozyma monospora]|uniref:Unnamed protein product n=1 Tax=Ambrosiozyma monospora TaxID=43982 RepID=A0ACB5SWU2_AMBMO|nr:unnamed protein product [Ambrosiozyma monospora]
MGGLKFLFTGDYSREEDRHLSCAEVPPTRPDLLITESTFGTATHVPRIERETSLTQVIHSTLHNGGKCLLPVFALGRAQEILLILDEYWQEHSDLQNFPIFYASDLAKKCMAVYQRYINMMNDNIRKRFTETNHNPFHFKYIKNITNIEKLDDLNPCVIIASPGMLQNGISRKVLERWSPDPKNSLIMTGYSVEGTMAKNILTEPNEIPSITDPDLMIPRRINIEEISFAAHVDYEQNSEFIELVNPKTIILVHGESNPMGRLKSALLSKYQKLKNTEEEVKVYNPRNGSKLSLEFKGIKVVKVMGQLATALPKDGEVVNGVLVQKNFDLNLLKVEDLREFSGLTTTVVKQRQTLRCNANKHLVNWQFTQMFGYVNVNVDVDQEYTFEVMGSVLITLNEHDGLASVEWQSGMVEDTIADSSIAILMSCDSSPASVKISSQQHDHHHNHNHNEASKSEETPVKEESEDVKMEIDEETNIAVKQEKLPNDDDSDSEPKTPVLELHADYRETTRLQRVCELLKVQFGDSFSSFPEENRGSIKIGNTTVKIDYTDFKVSCANPKAALKGRVEGVLGRTLDLVAPLSHN